MIPIVTPEEMKEIDAGAAVARAALDVLGGSYGRRVVVVAGKGNNGADGRDAARRLRARGVRVQVMEAADCPDRVPASDLVVDAAYGTGFRGDYDAPDPGDAVVLAVDIPSGVDGLTGVAGEGAVSADLTVTFAALKPGLLLADGPTHAGPVEVVDIGLDVSSAAAALVESVDVSRWLPSRPADSHKWRSAVWVVAGSPGMTGAARLCASAVLRSGAGLVRLGVPGEQAPMTPLEVVGRPLPPAGWDGTVLDELDRFKALVVGPGLGREDVTVAAVRALVAAAPCPVIVDADGLTALGDVAQAAAVIGDRRQPTVLTPHDGEFERLAGRRPGPDRIGGARDLARGTGATVLLKGSTTIVAGPDGRVLLAAAGDARLATAGTGDVLSGVVGAFLAQGLGGVEAAAGAAHVHGLAARRGWPRGLVAGDLLDFLPAVLSELG